MKKVAIITLGCAKNTVDSELIASSLRDGGVDICSDPLEATAAIVNTCGFIDKAKEESINTILGTADLKGRGKLRFLVVGGCLAKRYASELQEDMPEVDVLTGVAPRETADAVLRLLGAGAQRRCRSNRRIQRLTSGPWAYVRISEGCDNRCSYCAIPLIRGPLVSRRESDILDEAAELAERGVRELNLIAQDTTSYGLDTGEVRLHQLLRNMCKELPGIWIRLLYTHPAHYCDELIETLSEYDQLCPYLDIPLQHINDRVLRSMGRRIGREGIESLLTRLRSSVPSLTLRTTFMVGYPAEDAAAFEELMEFIESWRFERMGAFTYSPEEGTPAGGLSDAVSVEEKQERYHRLMSAQRRIACDLACARIGEVTQVLVEEEDSSGSGGLIGRSPHEAPEVDPVIFLPDGEGMEPGTIVQARITAGAGYDLVAEPTEKAGQ